MDTTRPTHQQETPPATVAVTTKDVPVAGGCADSCSAASVDAETRSTGWHRAARRARLLSWLSLVWMSAEGALGLAAGLQAGSLSLLGWALGSVIEGLASVIVIWRFTGSRTLSDTAETRAQQGVAVSFFLLAPYLVIAAIRDLLGGHQAGASTLGVVVTASSLFVMPALGVAKRRLGVTLGSGATGGEGVQNLICAAQAAAVLVGLAATTAFGWSWLDPVIALFLAGWAIREGVQAWRGEDCC